MKADRFWKRYWRRCVWLLCVLFWICFIFSNSAQSATQSSESSGRVLAWLNEIAEGCKLPFRFSSFFVRKAAHFAEYAVLGILLPAGALSKARSDIPHFLRIGGAGLLVGFLIACIDEGIQYFQEGRSAQWSDVLLDSSGVVFGCFLLLTVGYFHYKLRNLK